MEELHKFCLINERIINKMFKQNKSLYNNDFDRLIMFMPNLLNFENKRTFFKAKLSQMRKNYGQNILQLLIKRDDIFMNAYT